MESEVTLQPGYILIRIKGDMRLWGRPEMERTLLDKFRASFDDNVRSVILNLVGLTSLDTMGIAALVRVLIECTKRKVGLKIVMPAGVPGESLRRVRIFEAWPSFHDEQTAVAACSS